MIRLYGVARLPAHAVTGVFAEPVDALAALAAVVDEPARPTLANVQEHAAVVAELAAVNDPFVPARFGTELAGLGELHDAVALRRRELEDALTLVEGCVEFGVRVVAAESKTVAASGRAYLGARLAEEQRRRAVAARLRAPLEPLARASRYAEPAGALVAASYLVPRGDAPRFLEAAAALDHADGRVVATGPWPAYTFAEAR
jgi:hypothetical protein